MGSEDAEPINHQPPRQFTALITERFSTWDAIPFALRDVFDEPSPNEVAMALHGFCARFLGAGIEHGEFLEASVGTVCGVRLRDHRRVVVKLHGHGTSVGFLEAVQRVQQALAKEDVPCPMPLVGPTPLRRGTAVAETLLDKGDHADAHDPGIRAAMAEGLAHLVAYCDRLAGLDGLRQATMDGSSDRLWPRPHDRRFDFEATRHGAEWIDRIATSASQIRDRLRGQDFVGHTDWRAENMRFEQGRISAVYDWDSLRIEPEPVLVGWAAHGFTMNWAIENERQLPTLDEALAFAAEYEAARDGPFTAQEEQVLRAALVYAMAYTARCEHSDLLTDFGEQPPTPRKKSSVPAGTARAFLAAHASELLGAEVGSVPTIV